MPEIKFAAQPAAALSRFEFMNRFTMQELSAIESSGETDPELRVWMRMVGMASFIELDHPRVTSGLEMLVQKGVITAGRKTELLQS
jgi:hypothetical protein